MAAATAMVLAALFMACSSEKTADKPDADQTQSRSSQTPQTAKKTTQTEVIQYKASDIPFDLNGTPVSIGGLTFVPATQWQVLEATGEKKAFYSYGPLVPDSLRAEMSVYYFGRDAGDWEDRMERWINQISFPGDRDPHGAAIRHDRVVGDMNAHVLSIFGAYTPPTEGFDKEEVALTRPQHRINAVVVEAPQGYVYFKLTGPEYTARIMIEAFMNMIYSLQMNP
jgi:hypothetical protein